MSKAEATGYPVLLKAHGRGRRHWHLHMSLTLTRSATTLRLLAGTQLFMISMLSRMKDSNVITAGALPYTRVKAVLSCAAPEACRFS